VVTADAHTGGEPLRVILGGFPEIQGDSVLERRAWASTHHDAVRRALMWEPRGHADMYGCIVLPPVTREAHLSVLFTHNEGYSTMCGHGIIAVATVLVECGLVEAAEPHAEIGIDTPAGFVLARVQVRAGRAIGVAFVNVPSFAAALDAQVDVGGVGHVRYDLAYGGAFYAYVKAEDFGLRLVPEEASQLIELGRAIKNAVQSRAAPNHPDHPDLGFVYGTIFVGAAHDPGNHSRNVCVFADGEVDRSPTGTGVSGRLAIHAARGEVGLHEEVIVESIVGSRFTGRILRESRVGSHAAVIPEVAGRAWLTGRSEFLIDPEDPLRAGFLLR
jgi:trans-L-3-hydroxyproline dehydratase